MPPGATSLEHAWRPLGVCSCARALLRACALVRVCSARVGSCVRRPRARGLRRACALAVTLPTPTARFRRLATHAWPAATHLAATAALHACQRHDGRPRRHRPHRALRTRQRALSPRHLLVVPPRAASRRLRATRARDGILHRPGKRHPSPSLTLLSSPFSSLPSPHSRARWHSAPTRTLG